MSKLAVCANYPLHSYALLYNKEQMNKTDPYKPWVRVYAHKYWWVFVIIGFLTILSVGMTLLSPIPLAFMADYVFGDNPPVTLFGVSLDWPKEQLLLLAVGGYLGIYILANLYDSFRAVIEQKLLQVIDATAMEDVFSASMLIPYNTADREDNGKYIYKITDQSQVMSTYLFGNFSVLFQSTITIISILIILLFIDLRMTLFALLVVPALVCIVRFFSKRIEQRAEDAQQAESAIYDHVGSSLEKIRTIQEFSLEKRKVNELHGFIRTTNRAYRKLLFMNRGYSLSTETAILIAIGAIILTGGHMVFQGYMSFGILLLFINYISSMSDPLVTVTQTIGSIQEQIASLKQARTVLDTAETSQPVSGKLKDIPVYGKVGFNHIFYAIDDKVIADDISIEFSPGKVYVITGPSGEGKSTLLSMVQRFTQPLRGTITIDNIDIREFDIHFLRSKVAVVDQQPDLFAGSVQDNIILSDPQREFSLLHVMAAAHLSNSDEFIQKLPEKYDTPVSDEKLSGGQKQRLSIARASYREAPIIIMDEPTSALDKRSAEIFLNNLSEYNGNKTIFIITHDMDVIQHFEHVFTLNNGKLTQLVTAPPSPPTVNQQETGAA